MSESLELETQILIIGSGFAGVVAAVKSKDKDVDVILVRKGYGATALSSGGFDVAVEKLYKFNSGEGLPSLPSNIKKIVDSPYHPYRILVKAKGDDNQEGLKSVINNSIKYFFPFLDKIKFDGSWEEVTLLPNPLGTIKLTNFSLASIYPGNINRIKEGNLLFVGIEGFTHFPARFISQSYNRILGRSQKIKNSCGYFYLSSPKFLNQSDLSPFELARMLEEDIKSQFLEEIITKLKGRRCTHIFFPAILGIEKTDEIITNLNKNLNAICCEVISPPPSVPGFRLQKALDHILRKRGIKIIRGEVTSAIRERNKIVAVKVKDRNKEYQVQADNFILATGKFIGGGIKHRDFLQEPIFNLPLFYKNHPVNKTLVEDLLEKDIVSRPPLFSVGIKVNPLFQPVDEKDRVVFQNLFAAGSILGGYDYLRDGCGLGVALLSGYLSAINATGGDNR